MVDRSDKQIEIKAVQKENLAGIIRRVYERFIRIRGEPREVALGFALGIFIGMTPTIGVQTPIAIFFAALFKWSKLSAAIGVWVSNPLTAPLIYGFTYIIGAKLMGLDPVFNMPLSPTWSTLKAMLQKAPQALGAMTAGGAIIGIPLAIVSSLYPSIIKTRTISDDEYYKSTLNLYSLLGFLSLSFAISGFSSITLVVS